MGRLERQKITDQAEAEKARRELITLQSQSAAIESTGQATAGIIFFNIWRLIWTEAKARAESAQIEGQAAVKQAQLAAAAAKIKSEAEIENLKQKQVAEVGHQKSIDGLEITKVTKSLKCSFKKFLG